MDIQLPQKGDPLDLLGAKDAQLAQKMHITLLQYQDKTFGIFVFSHIVICNESNL